LDFLEVLAEVDRRGAWEDGGTQDMALTGPWGTALVTDN
jgi:hypothetical protein